MPCLELKVAARPHPEPGTRLRSLLEKPGAAVLRRNYIPDVPGYDDLLLRNSIRIAAVLAVDLTDPPREPEPPAPKPAPEAEESESAESPVQPSEPPAKPAESTTGSFAKGIEIWITDGPRTVCVPADIDEIPGALAMFDAYVRLARFQPAFVRLDKRLVGMSYLFREGLTVGVQGDPADAPAEFGPLFGAIAAIPEVDDSRDTRIIVRLPNAGISFFHDLLRAAAAWLEQNSYPSILGSK